MIVSVLRKTFAKDKPKTVFYRCYNFDQDSFNETLKNRISLLNLSFEIFFEIFHSTLDFFAPYKQTNKQTNKQKKNRYKTAFYRCYKTFDQDSFNETLNNPDCIFLSCHVRVSE